MIPEKIPKETVEEIVRLSSEGGLTHQEIGERVGVSKATVGKYIRDWKRKLNPKVRRYFGAPELSELCEIIVPLIREKLQEGNPSELPDEGEGKEKNKKEEKEMGDEELATKVQMLLERQRQQERMASDLAVLREDIKVIKDQGGKLPQELTERIDKLEGTIDTVSKETKSFCEKFPQLCDGQEYLVKEIQEIKERIPKGVLGTDLSREEFLKDDESQKVLIDKYLSSAGMRMALERCSSPECKAIREEAKKRGIKLQRKAEGSGMIGSGWEDLD